MDVKTSFLNENNNHEDLCRSHGRFRITREIGYYIQIQRKLCTSLNNCRGRGTTVLIHSS